jgi:LysM repeat protein
MAINYGSEPFVYTIQPEDTLWDLADDLNVSVEEIMAVNANLDPNQLHVGQVINLPVESSQRRGGGGRGPGGGGRRPYGGGRGGRYPYGYGGGYGYGGYPYYGTYPPYPPYNPYYPYY